MKYQSRSFTCGPATLSNVLQIYGMKVREEDACKSTTNGTTERAILAGIRKHGLDYEIHRGRDGLDAMGWLNVSLALGTPTILCVDSWSHWIAAVGKLGGRYLIVDPADDELLLCLTQDEIVKRWKYDSRYYGIGVIKHVSFQTGGVEASS